MLSEDSLLFKQMISPNVERVLVGRLLVYIFILYSPRLYSLLGTITLRLTTKFMVDPGRDILKGEEKVKAIKPRGDH